MPASQSNLLPVVIMVELASRLDEGRRDGQAAYRCIHYALESRKQYAKPYACVSVQNRSQDLKMESVDDRMYR